MKFFAIVLLLLNVSVFSYAFDESEIRREIEQERLRFTCGADSVQGVGFRFCYRNLETTNSDDIIYFFHGLEGSEETWFTQYFGTLMVQKWWKHWGYRPRIVTVSFGPQWLLVDNARYPLLPLFVQGVLPLLEKKVGGLRRGHRHLIGQSMGGFNAAEVSLKASGIFNKVALLCPAIATVSPFDSSDKIEDYIQRTGASREKVQTMLQISRSVFIDPNDWTKHDPLRLLKKPQTKKSRYFVSVGESDDYGFQEGAEEFVEISRQSGFQTKWIPVAGGHCQFNRKGTAHFFMGN